MGPDGACLLTSVHYYLLQAVNYVEDFANFSGKSTACFGTSETLAPSGGGNPIPRNTDSEYKILSNLADKLGDKFNSKGQVTIFTERRACQSCLGVIEQFKERYPNIKINVISNENEKILNPNQRGN